MYRITDAFRNRVNEIFNKTEENVQNEVKEIREWLETQHHLPEIMDDIKIRNMLTLCKFNIKKAKEKIDNYYTVRSQYQDLYNESNPKLPKMKEALKNTNISNHPELLDGLYRILFIRTKAPGVLQAKEVSMWYLAVLELRLQVDLIVNDIVVVDMGNFTFRDMCSASLPLMIKVININKAVYSLRVKNTYFINSPTYITMFMKIMQLLMPTKIYKRMRVSKDAEILKEVFPDHILPKDYGGNGPSLEELDDMMQEVFDKHQDRFDLLDTLRVDESLRPKS